MQHNKPLLDVEFQGILLTAAVECPVSLFGEACHFAAGTTLEQLYERRAASRHRTADLLIELLRPDGLTLVVIQNIQPSNLYSG